MRLPFPGLILCLTKFVISIAEDYNLELQYRKSFAEVWSEEKDSPVFGPLSERMGVRGRDAGPLLVSEEEMEAAGKKVGLCKQGSCTDYGHRLLSCILLLQNLTLPIFSSFKNLIRITEPWGSNMKCKGPPRSVSTHLIDSQALI